MAVAEILMTKKECFTIYEDGHITMTRGKFKPSKPLLHDVCERPQKPEKGPWDFVQHNIWGEEIYRENSEIHCWRLECERIDKINASAHKEQAKEFKRHLLAVRKNYYQQEAIRKKKEKLERIASQSKETIRSLLGKDNQKVCV